MSVLALSAAVAADAVDVFQYIYIHSSTEEDKIDESRYASAQKTNKQENKKLKKKKTLKTGIKKIYTHK